MIFVNSIDIFSFSDNFRNESVLSCLFVLFCLAPSLGISREFENSRIPDGRPQFLSAHISIGNLCSKHGDNDLERKYTAFLKIISRVCT